VLHGGLDEHAEALLEVDDLQAVLARGVDGGFLEGDGGEGAAELVDLGVGCK
jgi:hypothetical protein